MIKNTIYIKYGTESIPILISKPTDPDFKDIQNAVYIECGAAGFAQEYDISDLPQLLTLLPELIEEKRSRDNAISFHSNNVSGYMVSGKALGVL